MSFTASMFIFSSPANLVIGHITVQQVIYFEPGTLYTRYILHGVVGFFLMGLGTTGNVLSIVVLATQSSNSVNFLLVCLAVADTFFLVNGILLYTLGTINRYNGLFREYREVMPYAIPFINGMAFLSHSLTVWLVVVITIDRYIAVCYPLKSVNICTRGRARRVIAILVISLTLFSLPRFFEKTAGYVYDAELDNEHAMLTVVYREFHQYPVYIYLYETVLYGGCQFLFPLLLLISLNVRLLWGLNQARINRNMMLSSSKKQQKDDNVSTMIVVVISVFIICQFPNFLSYALRLLEVFDSSNAIVVNPQGSSLLNPITETLLRINSSVNFLIYMLVGKEFRKVLFRIFGCSKRINKTK
ncbi:FMRFamide receptor-like [Lineus longissimus]|uniref:FMRFamide receptor-like n=1 Tax=Lineus longissimus TaxID=88925 RepID=UPI00315D1578